MILEQIRCKVLLSIQKTSLVNLIALLFNMMIERGLIVGSVRDFFPPFTKLENTFVGLRFVVYISFLR